MTRSNLSDVLWKLAKALFVGLCIASVAVTFLKTIIREDFEIVETIEEYDNNEY